jgi:hypothetical protein
MLHPGEARLRVRALSLSRWLAVVALLVLSSRDAHAYAWMIRHEYGACSTCHADPSGGGLLTAYGRAQGETLLRTHYRGGADSEDPGTVGDFLWGAVPLPENLLLGGDFRAFTMYIKPEGAPGLQQTFIMQADAEGQVSFDRFRLNASLGYAKQGALAASVTHGTSDRLISRVLWAGVDLGADNEFLLRAGRMNLPFGIRSIEHTLWVRSETRTDINDSQEHGVAFAYTGERVRAEAMAILGNYQIHPDALRQRGYSAYAEYIGIPRLGFGVSSLVTHTNTDSLLQTPLFHHSHGLFARYAPVKELVLQTETDFLLESQPKKNQFGVASELQADLELLQGLHLVGTGEVLNASLSKLPPSYRLWATLAWFFLPHADLRLDAVWESQGTLASRANADVFLAQIHVYL